MGRYLSFTVSGKTVGEVRLTFDSDKIAVKSRVLPLAAVTLYVTVLIHGAAAVMVPKEQLIAMALIGVQLSPPVPRVTLANAVATGSANIKVIFTLWESEELSELKALMSKLKLLPTPSKTGSLVRFSVVPFGELPKYRNVFARAGAVSFRVTVRVWN